MWTLFVRLATQWRYSFGGRAGLDYGPVLGVIQAKGWHLERALELLGAIEGEVLEWDGRERDQPSRS